MARFSSSWRNEGRPGVRWPHVGVSVLTLLLCPLTLASCAAAVPDPSAATPAPAASAIATSSLTPERIAEAAASKDLPLSAGDTLPEGVPVGISDGLKDAPGWKAERLNVQGENTYIKGDGCSVSSRIRVNQGSLAVEGNDKASTAELFQYFDPSILPEYLRVDTLCWGRNADDAGHRAEVLALEGNTNAEGRATTVLARLFAKAGSSVHISISCPDGDKLRGARVDVTDRLALVASGS